MATTPNKAPDFNTVIHSALKVFHQHILPNITNIINSSFTNSIFSQVWNRGEVVHYLKDGNYEVPSNNRPIS